MGNDNNDFNFDDIGISAMKVAANQLHEMYVEFRAAGFSRSQALRLVSDMLTAGVQSANNDE